MASTKLDFDVEIFGNVMPIKEGSVLLIGLRGMEYSKTDEIREMFEKYFPSAKILIYNREMIDIKVAIPFSEYVEVKGKSE